MAYLIERRARVLYITASSITGNGKRRKIVIECRPEYAVISLQGLKQQFPICWEAVLEAAKRRHTENLCIEAKANKQRKSSKKRPS